jgi:hypothetical protein
LAKVFLFQSITDQQSERKKNTECATHV